MISSTFFPSISAVVDIYPLYYADVSIDDLCIDDLWFCFSYEWRLSLKVKPYSSGLGYGYIWGLFGLLCSVLTVGGRSMGGSSSFGEGFLSFLDCFYVYCLPSSKTRNRTTTPHKQPNWPQAQTQAKQQYTP